MLRALVTADINYQILCDTFDGIISFELAGYGYNHEMLPHETFKEKCKSIDILVSEFDTVSSDVLNEAKNLRAIFCCRGGVSTVIDLECARLQGVKVYNAIGRNVSSCAEFTICLALDLLRNISKTNQLIHDNIITTNNSRMPKEYKDSLWGLDNSSPYILYRAKKISETTLGIIGYGHVGKAVADMALSIGMKVIVTSPSLCRLHPEIGIEIVTLDELLARSDIVTLHASGNIEKKPILSMDEFAKMKRTAYLINTSRGYLIDEVALIDALNNNVIRGAALDVTQQEPLSPDNPLLKSKNLILTPHIAGSSDETISAGTDIMIDAIYKWLNEKDFRDIEDNSNG